MRIYLVMPDDRDGPGRKPRVEDDEILTVIRESDKPVLPTAAIAEELPIKHRGTLKRLNRLLDEGRINRMEVGPRGQVWYVDEDETAAETPQIDADESDDQRDRLVEPEPESDKTDEQRIEAVVDNIAEGWTDDDDRLADRKAAARAVLEHAINTGNAVGKSDAVDTFYDQYPVDGQSEDTWWRKNVRPVLREIGTYSNAEHGYIADPLALKDAAVDTFSR